MLCLSVLALACSMGSQNQPSETKPSIPAIIPRPVMLELQSGTFSIKDSTAILIQSRDPQAQAVGEYLASWLRQRTGFKLPVRKLTNNADSKGHFLLATAGSHMEGGNEAYHLTISPERVGVFAPRAKGLFYAVQTIRQLLPPELESARAAAVAKTKKTLHLPCLRITDNPRYRWRGLLLDCGRHFMSKEFIKRTIDLLAYHKMNVLHWHLTEDQGWRIEIKKYPKLTELGAWRKATRDSEQPRENGLYGGFYSQDDIKEIVAYAKSRFIEVIPEIEMPGHSGGALAAYPELSCTGGPFEVSTRWGVHKDVYCAGDDKTFEFLQDVLTEVIELFPAPFIHIGGDECPKDRWKACENCQARIKAEGLAGEHELQSYFIRRIEKFLSSKGRRLIGWDEILEGGLAPQVTVQSWRGLKGAVAAAKAGHDVISSPTSHCYLDYPHSKDDPGYPSWMGVTSLEQIYSFEPTPSELSPEQAKHILGAECNMWTEHAPQDLVDKQVFPRLCALAEVTWSPKKARDWKDFSARMKTHYRRLEALGVTYYRPPTPPPRAQQP